MKTCSEVLKNVLADGGFKVLAAKCGQKGEVTQLQDIHNILAACHEALLRLAVKEYNQCSEAGSHRVLNVASA